MNDSSHFDCVVLGAGAAGLMCAFEAGRRGRRVLLLDNGARPGRKILISGGGRCNFTNTGTRAENFLGANPHFAKSALARFQPSDMVALVEKHGVRHHEKKLGQLFCDGSAQQIVDLLLRECAEACVELRTNTDVLAVERRDGSHAPMFAVSTNTGQVMCGALVVATGGLSIPKLGATGFGYDLARTFGHTVVDPRPALVPLVFTAEDRERWCDLTGLSTDVMMSVSALSSTKRNATPRFREKMLITHRGLSGPAVLQISSYWRAGETVHVDLSPAVAEALLDVRTAGRARDRNAVLLALRTVLPARFAERWLEQQEPLPFSDAGLRRLEQTLHSFSVRPAGTEGFEKAEVTAGGVDTRELDSNTLMSRRVPGLYFIGEVVDVTGWLGGYNFQWAWASATAAGRSV